MADVGVASASTTDSAGDEEFLYTVESAGAISTPLKVDGPEDEKFRLTLSGVAPVTVFANRPFRDATLISPRALDANWDAWFGDDPPNAVLTFSRFGLPPASMVVELTNPSFSVNTRTLSCTETLLACKHDPVEKGKNWQKVATPSSMTDVSPSIDLANKPPKES